jgi:hypothetical protein
MRIARQAPLMKQLISHRGASLALFVVAGVLVLATAVLSIVPPPPSKVNTGAPIWLAWAALISILGFALRSQKRSLWIAAAVIAVPAALVNLPFDLGTMTTWADYATNGLAALVALASVFAFATAVIAVLKTLRRAESLRIQ